MEDRLAECCEVRNTLNRLSEGGIHMFRKLFDGGRKFVTLMVLVVALGALSVWIGAQVGPQTVPLRVTALEAELTSIKVPVNGVWMETGPIKISLPSSEAQFPVGKLDVREGRATLVWPVSISAPILHKLGLGKIETFLIGIGKRRSPDEVIMTNVDFAVLRIPGLPSMVIANTHNWCIIHINIRATEDIWAGKAGAEASSTFGPLDEKTFRTLNVRQLVEEGFSVASQFMHFPIEDVKSFLDNVVQLIQEQQHEIVVYIAEYNSYQTADLQGTATLRVER